MGGSLWAFVEGIQHAALEQLWEIVAIAPHRSVQLRKKGHRLIFNHRLHHGLLIGEVAVDRASRNFGAQRNIVDCGASDAAVQVATDGRVENAVAPALLAALAGIAAPALDRILLWLAGWRLRFGLLARS